MAKPLCYDGPGVKDLRLQGLALRTRWEWLRRTDGSRPWQGLPMLKDTQAAVVFDSLARFTIGNGRATLFWKDRWITGRAASNIAPLVIATVSARCRNRRLWRKP